MNKKWKGWQDFTFTVAVYALADASSVVWALTGDRRKWDVLTILWMLRSGMAFTEPVY